MQRQSAFRCHDKQVTQDEAEALRVGPGITPRLINEVVEDETVRPASHRRAMIPQLDHRALLVAVVAEAELGVGPGIANNLALSTHESIILKEKYSVVDRCHISH